MPLGEHPWRATQEGARPLSSETSIARPLAANVARVRAATRADAPLLLSLIKELADYERLAHEVEASEARITETLFGAQPVAEAVICEVDKEPVGCAVFFPTYSTFLARAGIYLEDLYVRPSHRGQGYGRLMLRHLARLVREREGARLEWSVLHWNRDAIRFYETLGATALDEWKRFRLSGEALKKLALEKASTTSI